MLYYCTEYIIESFLFCFGLYDFMMNAGTIFDLNKILSYMYHIDQYVGFIDVLGSSLRYM